MIPWLICYLSIFSNLR